jgi:hypothetical protein
MARSNGWGEGDASPACCGGGGRGDGERPDATRSRGHRNLMDDDPELRVATKIEPWVASLPAGPGGRRPSRACRAYPTAATHGAAGVLTRTETLETDWSCAVARVKCPGRKSTGKKGSEMCHRVRWPTHPRQRLAAATRSLGPSRDAVRRVLRGRENRRTPAPSNKPDTPEWLLGVRPPLSSETGRAGRGEEGRVLGFAFGGFCSWHRNGLSGHRLGQIIVCAPTHAVWALIFIFFSILLILI